MAQQGGSPSFTRMAPNQALVVVRHTLTLLHRRWSSIRLPSLNLPKPTRVYTIYMRATKQVIIVMADLRCPNNMHNHPIISHPQKSVHKMEADHVSMVQRVPSLDSCTCCHHLSDLPSSPTAALSSFPLASGAGVLVSRLAPGYGTMAGEETFGDGTRWLCCRLIAAP